MIIGMLSISVKLLDFVSPSLIFSFALNIDRIFSGQWFLKNLKEALKMQEVQSNNFAEFDRRFQPELIKKWEKLVDEWEKDRIKQYNNPPYLGNPRFLGVSGTSERH
jgi:hypothetical protein